ncbi:glycosyltransferase family protein [Melaminivora jejuensis]|uniref:glycosyltransferase family protein n=1 Tax=Melaminivora jejuensis TaxID=1267217 RepID=UPI00398B0D7D
MRFIGGVYEPAQLQSLRLHAACHLHGHSVGGTNPSLLEALACGNWVIAHDNPFNREVARDAADYFADPAALAAALAAWAATPPAQRRARAARARQIIARHYTWEQIADRYEALALEQCRAGRQQVRA